MFYDALIGVIEIKLQKLADFANTSSGSGKLDLLPILDIHERARQKLQWSLWIRKISILARI
jgi:hypothetical protein